MPKIAVKGTQVGYTRAGSGEPMILLRNSAGSKVQWDAVRHCLQDRFEVLTADLPAMAKPAAAGGPTSHPVAVAAAITRHLDAQPTVDGLAA